MITWQWSHLTPLFGQKGPTLTTKIFQKQWFNLTGTDLDEFHFRWLKNQRIRCWIPYLDSAILNHLNRSWFFCIFRICLTCSGWVFVSILQNRPLEWIEMALGMNWTWNSIQTTILNMSRPLKKLLDFLFYDTKALF